MRLLIFLGVAVAVVWAAQNGEWDRKVPTARELGASAAEILAEFQEGELVATPGRAPLPRPESAVADSSTSLRTESAVADSSGRGAVRRDAFGGEAELGAPAGTEVPAVPVEARVSLERADAREIQTRLDRVMSLAAGRQR